MKICLDAGHGGYDSGAVGNGLREKDITLNIVLAMRDILVAKGHQVILTRDSDTSPRGITNTSAELQARCNIANEANADLFISIHINCFADSSANGAEVYYYSASGQGLAERCQRAQLAVMGNTNRGIKTANYAVIKYTHMPAVLCESGFISNPGEAAKYRDDNIIRSLANGYCEAILNTKIESNPIYTQKQPVAYADTCIKTLQSNLNSLINANLMVDGVLGDNTKKAIIQFQSTMGLAQDGITGPSTNAAIQQILSKPTLSRGSSYNYAIRWLQWRLNISIDGAFGWVTSSVVQSFQARHGLTPDGVVGPKTWEQLFK